MVFVVIVVSRHVSWGLHYFIWFFESCCSISVVLVIIFFNFYMFSHDLHFPELYCDEFVWFSDGICGRHLHIMVRTRGLGRTLGRVIGRALGRKDRHDLDDAPQR